MHNRLDWVMSRGLLGSAEAASPIPTPRNTEQQAINLFVIPTGKSIGYLLNRTGTLGRAFHGSEHRNANQPYYLDREEG